MLNDLSQAELVATERDLANRLATLRRANLSLDLTRGKPSPEQLALSDQVELMTGNDFNTEVRQLRREQQAFQRLQYRRWHRRTELRGTEWHHRGPTIRFTTTRR